MTARGGQVRFPASRLRTACVLLLLVVVPMACAPATATPSMTGSNSPTSGRQVPTLLPAASSAAASADHGLFLPISSPGPGSGPAARMCDGRVLAVQGGAEPAAVYDPATRRFSLTGAPLRYLASAALFVRPDCHVVLVGSGAAGTTEAERFDPSTGTFTAAGSSNISRTEASQVLLGNGKVLVVGGSGNSGDVLASAEIYDPATQRFQTTGRMSTPRAGAVLTLLGDGRVLVTGGRAKPFSDSPSLASAEIFDPAAGKFVATGAMSTGRTSHAAAGLTDGRVLVLGGVSPTDGWVGSAELYDPIQGRFTPAGSMATPRVGAAAILLPNGRVLIAGGMRTLVGPSFETEYLDSAELFDPTSGHFTATGSLARGHAYSSPVLLADGNVLLVSGQGAPGVPSSLLTAIYVP